MSTLEDRAFPVLSPSQIAEAAPFGRERTVAAGEALFEAGEASYELFVVLEGEAVVVRDTKDRTGHVLRFTPSAWHQFAQQLKMGKSSSR